MATMRLAPTSLASRLILGASLWILAALLAAGLILSALFSRQVEHDFDRRLAVLMETLIMVTDGDEQGAIQLLGPQGDPRFEQPLSGWYWQIETEGSVQLASRSLWDRILEPPRPARALLEKGGDTVEPGLRLAGPGGQELRGLERVVRFETGPEHRYLVAGDASEIDAALAPFRRTLAIALALLGLGLFGAVAAQVWFGLHPLGRLRRALARVRRGEARRIDGPYPGEIAPLVAEANSLLDHGEDMVMRARTHLGNLAHALKTPLSVLALAAEDDRSPLGDTVRREAFAMRARIDHHLARARAAGSTGGFGQTAETGPILNGLVQALGRMFRDRGLAIRLDPGEDPGEAPPRREIGAGTGKAGAEAMHSGPPPAFRGDAQDLEEMLGNLLENACKWAASEVRVSAGAGAGGRLCVIIEDDGPGLDPAERARALARGERLDETVPGSGLGLAIVAEIAALYDGALKLETSPLGGLKAILDLPGTASPRPAREGKGAEGKDMVPPA